MRKWIKRMKILIASEFRISKLFKKIFTVIRTGKIYVRLILWNWIIVLWCTNRSSSIQHCFSRSAKKMTNDKWILPIDEMREHPDESIGDEYWPLCGAKWWYKISDQEKNSASQRTQTILKLLNIYWIFPLFF